MLIFLHHQQESHQMILISLFSLLIYNQKFEDLTDQSILDILPHKAHLNSKFLILIFLILPPILKEVMASLSKLILNALQQQFVKKIEGFSFIPALQFNFG